MHNNTNEKYLQPNNERKLLWRHFTCSGRQENVPLIVQQVLPVIYFASVAYLSISDFNWWFIELKLWSLNTWMNENGTNSSKCIQFNWKPSDRAKRSNLFISIWHRSQPFIDSFIYLAAIFEFFIWLWFPYSHKHLLNTPISQALRHAMQTTSRAAATKNC